MLRIRKRLLIPLAVCLLPVALFLCRAPLLRTAADIWIIDQPPARADVIIVPGGGLQNRPFAAAKLYHRGLAPKILIFRVKPSSTTELGLVPTEQKLTRSLLIAGGVPDKAIEEIGRDVASTWDEAMALRDWAANHHPRSLLVTTDPFHTRRVHWLFRKSLNGATPTPVITTTTAPRPEYSAHNWWATEQGLIDFQNEIAKYLFYRVSIIFHGTPESSHPRP